ncbi:tryptophan synthase subunit beta [Candidatus Neomarinimicrobiota bacterium]
MSNHSNNPNQPDSTGHYGDFGGQYVPETLLPALHELEEAATAAQVDDTFKQQLDQLYRDYVGRPSALYHAQRISEELDLEIYLKREDLNHTGAHKINNCIGQMLLALRMGKSRIIAETGAGQHGVATATVAARYGLECVVYMGEVDIKRQGLNVFRMELLGAEVRPVASGSRTLKDATNEAIRDWVANVENTHYLIGSAVGPHPYPKLVRDLQSIIGREARQQFAEQVGGLPDVLLACVGGGSNAIGLYHPFLDTGVEIFGVEASGRGLESGEHAATLTKGEPGVLHGSASYLLQTEDGQVQLPHSISAGLDYPGIGPEHAYLKDTGRVKYVSATDSQAVAAFQWLSRLEGIIPALESAHALAVLKDRQLDLKPGSKIIVCLSGRGDKDVETVAEAMKRNRS